MTGAGTPARPLSSLDALIAQLKESHVVPRAAAMHRSDDGGEPHVDRPGGRPAPSTAALLLSGKAPPTAPTAATGAQQSAFSSRAQQLAPQRLAVPAARAPVKSALTTIVLGGGLPQPAPAPGPPSGLQHIAAGRLSSAGVGATPSWQARAAGTEAAGSGGVRYAVDGGARRAWGSAAASDSDPQPAAGAASVLTVRSYSAFSGSSSSAVWSAQQTSSSSGSGSTTTTSSRSATSSRPSSRDYSCVVKIDSAAAWQLHVGEQPPAARSSSRGVSAPAGPAERGLAARRTTADSAASSSQVVRHVLGPRRPAACSKPNQRRLMDAQADPDPRAWLPDLHPAVGAALGEDLLPTSWQLRQQQGTRGAEPQPAAAPPSTPVLQAPSYPGACPTLVFTPAPLPEALGGAQAAASDPQQRGEEEEEEEGRSGVWRLQHVRPGVKYVGIANRPVKQVLKHNGFRRTQGAQWLLMWGSPQDAETLSSMGPLQRVNHFPGTYQLGRKDNLYKHVAAMRRLRGPVFDIVPSFFIMPRDLQDFRTDALRNPGRLYIQKPVASSRGRGIRMVQDPAAVDGSLADVLIQRYIHNPLLVNGRKFDLRVYVAVTCLDPLRVYVYKEGLVRFAARPYSTSRKSLGRRCCHLTNYSVNKKRAGVDAAAPASDGGGSRRSAAEYASTEAFQQALLQLSAEQATSEGEQARDVAGSAPDGGQPQEDAQQEAGGSEQPVPQEPPPDDEPQGDGAGLKWTFEQLREHLEARGVAWAPIWQQVLDMATKALIAAEPAMSTAAKLGAPHRTSCFEVFGLDVLLDEDGRAWMMEVNTSPALNADSPLDWRVKTSMIADLLHLVGLTPHDQQEMGAELERQRRRRLEGLPATAPAATKRAAGSKPAGKGGAKGGSSGKPGAAAGSRGSAGGARKQPAPAGAAGTSGAAAPAAVRSVQEANALDYGCMTAPQQLPEVVRETLAEAARRRSWQRTFPCPDQPRRYDELCALFATQRVSNVLLRRFYAHSLGA